MTSTLTPSQTRAERTDRAVSAVLREDGLVTAGVGLAAAFGTALAADDLWGDRPRWVPWAVSAVLVVVGADLVLAARWTGRRLRLAATVAMELATAWVLASVAVLVLADLPAAGSLAVGAVALVTGGFAAAYARLLRS